MKYIYISIFIERYLQRKGQQLERSEERGMGEMGEGKKRKEEDDVTIF